MTEMPKLLITAGILLIVVGLAWKFIGRLPGDIFVKKETLPLFSYHYMYCVKYCIIFYYVYNKSIQIRNRWI